MTPENLSSESLRIVGRMYDRRCLPAITLYFTEESVMPFVGIYPDHRPEGDILQRNPYQLNDKLMRIEGKTLADIAEILYRELLQHIDLPDKEIIPERDKERVGLVADGKRYDELLACLEDVETKEVRGMRFMHGALKGYSTQAIMYKVSELDGIVISNKVDVHEPKKN